MNNKLIDELAMLKLKEKNLKRVLDIYFYDSKKRENNFKELKKVKKDIEKIKFKLRIERKMKK